ncbi:MAG TPA: LTA synthase family protein [Methylomirabilota bacterium]|nr:LTA synthase family protein [Methylomirabilota bacterium]
MFWLVAAAASGAAEHDLEVRSRGVPGVLETAAEVVVPVEIHNRGRQAWAAEAGYALSYHWLAPGGEVVIFDGVRTELADPVGPGDGRVVDALVRAPDRAGDYLLQWDVVQEGVRWLSEADPTPPAPLPVRVRASHGFSFLEVDTPRLLVAGGQRQARMVLRNDGTATWPGDGSVSVAAHWLDGDGGVEVWEGRRTAIDRPVPPGAAIALEAAVAAPEGAGRFWLQWDMVEEGVCWFSERDGDPEPPVAVLVLPAALAPPSVVVVLTLGAAVAALGLRWRGRQPSRPSLWAAADVLWFVAALTFKQAWVLGAAGPGLAVPGWALAAAGAAVVGLVLLALPVRVRPWLAWTGALAATAVLYADLLHLRFFGDLGSAAALRSLGQAGQVGSSIASLLELRDLWFWADLPAALLLVAAVGRRGRSVGSRRVPAAGLAAVALAGGLVGAVGVGRAEASLRQVFHATELARRVGVLNLHALDLGRTALRTVARGELDGDKVRGVVRAFAERAPLRAGSGPAFGAAAGRNLVMIQVESLQAFVIGYRVGGEEVTPFLNGLAGGSHWFANVTDQTEEGRSSDAELATQVSLLPPDRGAAAFLYPGNDFTGLAQVLAEHGYETLSAVPFDGSFWNRRLTHPAYGYRHSLFADAFGPGATIGWGLNDRAFLTEMARRLAELPEPWAAYLLTLSLHHPFEGFPEHLEELDVGDWQGTPFGNFLHTMRYLDGALEALVAALDGAGLLERTVVALWGDHDAGFEWSPEIAAAVGRSPDARGWYLSQRVPLVIRVPDLPGPGGPLEVPAGHVDVAPTLAALLGIDPAPYPWLGRNLLGEPGPGPVVGEYRCFRDATHLYLHRGPSLSDGECIELATLRSVPAAACAASFEAARHQVQISEVVLEYDLQEVVRRSLAGELDDRSAAP